MAFILIGVGLLLFVTAYNGTVTQFGTMLKNDVFGSRGFVYWLVAIGVVGAVGYIKGFKGLSDAMIALLIVVLFLHDKGGFFSRFNNALGTTPQNTAGAAGLVGASGLHVGGTQED